MLILLALCLDFFVAGLCSSWVLHTALAYLLVRISLPSERTQWVMISFASLAFLLTDFAAHGVFGMGFLYLIPIMFLLFRLKPVLAHGATWLIFIGFCGFFVYEALVCGVSVTIFKISFNLIVGYLTLLGLQGNRVSGSCARK